MQGLPGKRGLQGPIGARGMPGSATLCVHQADIDGSGASGEGSGELEESLVPGCQGLMPEAEGMKGEKGQKVGFDRAFYMQPFY